MTDPRVEVVVHSQLQRPIGKELMPAFASMRDDPDALCELASRLMASGPWSWRDEIGSKV